VIGMGPVNFSEGELGVHNKILVCSRMDVPPTAAADKIPPHTKLRFRRDL